MERQQQPHVNTVTRPELEGLYVYGGRLSEAAVIENAQMERNCYALNYCAINRVTGSRRSCKKEMRFAGTEAP